jgi:hypothetical protein
MTAVEHLSQFRNLLIDASLLSLEAFDGGANQVRTECLPRHVS